MKKSFNVLYIFCWCCLFWAVIAAIPHAPIIIPMNPSAPDIPRWTNVLMCLEGILCIILLVFCCLRMTVAQSRRIQWVFRIITVALLFACGEVLYGIFNNWAKQLSWVLGGIMLGLLTAECIILSKLGKGLTREKNPIMWKIIILVTGVVAFTLLLPGMWGLPRKTITLPGDMVEYYVGQLSLTFITISVMSVLSDKSVIIYWENVAEAKLIRPLFCSFASYTGYSIAATVGAGISVLLDNALAFACFFGINVVALIFLTLTMVDVYYGREQKKATQAKLLRSAAPVYQLARTTGGKKSVVGTSRADYQEIMQNLQYHLHQEIEEHNVPYVCEVAELYGGNVECFDTEAGQRVKQMLFSAKIDIMPMIADGIAHRVSELERKHAMMNTLTNNLWREDYLLWTWLAKKENLPAVVENDAIKGKMLKIVLDRLTLLVNDVLNNSVPLYSPAIRTYSYNMVRARAGERRDHKVERGYDFVRWFVGANIVDGQSRTDRWGIYKQSMAERILSHSFLADLMRITMILWKKGDERTKEQIDNHLAVRAFRIYHTALEDNKK